MGGSAIRRRQLARELRELRESSGYSLEVAALKLEWSTSKLSRIETGQQTVDIHSVRGMLDIYDLGGDRAAHIQELCRAARQRGWWKAHGLDDLGYVAQESEASMVREFALSYVPGLLQTAEYARTLFAAAIPSPSAAVQQTWVEARMRRQRRLRSDSNPLRLVAVIDESVLRRPIGGTGLMRAQLEHLLTGTKLSTVTLHVLPFGSCNYRVLASGFVVLGFGHLNEPDIVHVDHAIGMSQSDKKDEVRRATLSFDQLRSVALEPADSVELIREARDQI